MEYRRTTVEKGKFPKKIEEDNEEEGSTFLSIGGKLPRIKALDLEAEYCGDSSTIAPEFGKVEVSGRSSTKEASGAVDCGRSSTVADDDNIFSRCSRGNGTCKSTKEEQKLIDEYYSHLNAVGPYDIEIESPKCLTSPLNPLPSEQLELTKKYHPEAFEQYFIGPAKFALQQINIMENKAYEFDGIVKFVGTPLQHVYLTIAGKQKVCIKGDISTYDRAIFQAEVYTPYGYNCVDYELREWKRKPDPDPAS